MTPCLDTLKPHLYKTRLPLLWGMVLAIWASGVGAETVNGAQLPDGVKKVAENRYAAHQNWEEALKYFKSAYPPSAYPRKSIVNQPGIKAVHIVNPSGKGFEGLNIYEANEEVRIYVIPAADVKKKPKTKK